MTQKEIRALFVPGETWRCQREAAPVVVHGNTTNTVITNKFPDTIRTVKKVATELVWNWSVDGVPQQPIYTKWPKTEQVIEARAGLLKFRYDNNVVCTFTKQQ